LPDGSGCLDLARALVERTVLFEEPSLFFGGVNVACREASGELRGVADHRRDGHVRVV
jgi:gamma-glutamyltranspeptidase